LPCVVVRTGWVERKLTAKELLLVWDLPATTIKNASVVVGKRLSQENMVPFKVRIHVAEANRVALTEGTKGATSCSGGVHERRNRVGKVGRRRSATDDRGSFRRLHSYIIPRRRFQRR
jgi:hypothetical protein